MKKTNLFKYLLGAVAVMSALNFVSCSKSDDDSNDGNANSGTLDTPAYESDAAKFVISGSSSSYKSIELTASGEYIIIPQGSPYAAKRRAAMRQSFFNFSTIRGLDTRASSTQILYGKYKKTGDGEYQLEGFGTVKVQMAEGTACSLTLTPTGGTSYTLQATKKTTVEGSTMTNQLCRSWTIDRVRFQLSFAGKSVDKTVTLDNQYDLYLAVANTWPEMMEGEPLMSREEFNKNKEGLFENTPERVVFTKSGTYMVYYEEGKLAVATWMWEDEASGKFRFSWNYNNMYDSRYSGVCSIEFFGSTLVFHEVPASGDGMTMNLTYYMAEVK